MDNPETENLELEEPFHTLQQIGEIILIVNYNLHYSYCEALTDICWSTSLFEEIKDMVPDEHKKRFETVRAYVQDVDEVDLNIILNTETAPFGSSTLCKLLHRIKNETSETDKAAYMIMVKDKFINMISEDTLTEEETLCMADQIDFARSEI
jgi:hypothetical protein